MDLSTVTETLGNRLSQEAVRIMTTRSAFAAEYCRPGPNHRDEDYLHHNEAQRRFVWTKNADMILDKSRDVPKR